MKDEGKAAASELEQRLRQIESSKTGSYEKRTRYKDPQGRPHFINRLILEDSPYLLQHAHNPVNWYGWGAEAFDTARDEDKPVFLSIGYSTCHWCHVMETESFDNVDIASLLNQHFICIKLDREQYPDIDEIYMTGVQIISGQGGWPMSNFLMPNGNPFFSATYFPPAQFSAVLDKIASIWQEKKAELHKSAGEIATTIEQVLQGRNEVKALDMDVIEAAMDKMLQREDKTHGGLAGAPKFPQEPLLLYFLEAFVRHNNLPAMEFSVRALEAMGRGGIYDQVAGGFHRYSTDAQWLVPHFEKMLYNQSQLSEAYLLAWRLTCNRFFKRIAVQTLDYVLREMQLPVGGFYSATDADSEDVEGLYFIWTITELRSLLNDAELALCMRTYELSEAGNFEDANILSLPLPMEKMVREQSFEDYIEDHTTDLDAILLKLRHAREKRIAPLRDDKLIVAWSAAMATSLARAGHELGNPAYLAAAEKAVDFMWRTNVVGHKSLRRIYLNGVVSIAGQLEDYVNLAEALITLFDVTQKRDHLVNAASLIADALKLFWNDESGGFFLSQQLEQGPLLIRSSNASDSATLAAFGVAINVLVALSRRAAVIADPQQGGVANYSDLIQKSISAVSAALDDNPPSHMTVVRAINHHLSGSTQLIQYAGAGQLRVEVLPGVQSNAASPGAKKNIKILLSLVPGFHITGFDTVELKKEQLESSASDPDYQQPIPLALTLQNAETNWELGAVTCLPIDRPASNPQSPYRDGFALEVTAGKLGSSITPGSKSIGLQLRVQLCNDKLCLPPETLGFRV